MKIIKYIAKPIFRWIAIIPIALLTLYNLFRQEINPDAPHFIALVANIPWYIMLLVLLLIIASIIIEALLNYYKENTKKAQYTSNKFKSTTVGQDNLGKIVQVAQENYGNIIFEGNNQGLQIDDNSILIVEIKEHKQKDGHLGYEVINNSKYDLVDCYVTLDEIHHVTRFRDGIGITRDLNPDGFLLTWSGGSREGKTTIPSNGGRKTINVAQYKDPYLCFIFQGLDGEVVKTKPEQGLYRLKLIMRGNLFGKPIDPFTILGYIKFQRYVEKIISDSGDIFPTEIQDGSPIGGNGTIELDIKQGNPPYEWQSR